MADEVQGTAQPAAEGSVTLSGTSDSGGEPSGVQKRINELTAEKKALEAQNQELMSNQQRLLEMQAQMLSAPQPQYQPPEPPKPKIQLPEGMDPVHAQFFENAMNLAVAQAVEQTEKRLAPQLRGTAMTVAQMEIERAGSGLDPAIVQRAHELWVTWQKRGLQGYEPGDAVKFAAGEFAVDPRRRTQARDDLGRFNKGTGGMLGTGAQPPIAPPSEPPVPPYADRESEQYDPPRAAAFWKDRLIKRGQAGQ